MRQRRTYVVDRKLQWAVAVQLLSVLGGIAVLYALGLYLLAGGGRAEGLSVGTVLRANVIYFVLAAAILVVATLLVMHRIAGPALVLERALRALAKGDHTARLTLRKRDYLKPLAAAVEDLRAELQRRARACEEAREALDRGDLDAARSLLVRARPTLDREPEPAARS